MAYDAAYDATCTPIDEARVEKPLSATDQLSEEIDVRRPLEAAKQSLAVSSQ
jgi:hypothetical protein